VRPVAYRRAPIPTEELNSHVSYPRSRVSYTHNIMTIKLNVCNHVARFARSNRFGIFLKFQNYKNGAALCARGVAGGIKVAQAHRRRAASARGRALGRRQPDLFHVHCQLPHVPLHRIHRVCQQKRLHRSR
jgi:hypothetical protein